MKKPKVKVSEIAKVANMHFSQNSFKIMEDENYNEIWFFFKSSVDHIAACVFASMIEQFFDYKSKIKFYSDDSPFWNI